jgi:hypothetical protein
MGGGAVLAGGVESKHLRGIRASKAMPNGERCSWGARASSPLVSASCRNELLAGLRARSPETWAFECLSISSPEDRGMNHAAFSAGAPHLQTYRVPAGCRNQRAGSPRSIFTGQPRA